MSNIIHSNVGKVGLSGNRFSGKKTVSNIFKTVHVPVFDADVILKFIINHNIKVVNDIKQSVGKHIFTQTSYINPKLVKSKSDFDKIVNCAEDELMRSFDRFCYLNSNSIYVIFKSSILFERNWNNVMDYNINIYCPKISRMERAKICLLKDKDFTPTINPATKKEYVPLNQISNFLRNEVDDLHKNSKSSFVIHNYNDRDPLSQVCKIDTILIDRYLERNKK